MSDIKTIVSNFISKYNENKTLKEKWFFIRAFTKIATKTYLKDKELEEKTVDETWKYFSHLYEYTTPINNRYSDDSFVDKFIWGGKTEYLHPFLKFDVYNDINSFVPELSAIYDINPRIPTVLMFSMYTQSPNGYEYFSMMDKQEVITLNFKISDQLFNFIKTKRRVFWMLDDHFILSYKNITPYVIDKYQKMENKSQKKFELKRITYDDDDKGLDILVHLMLNTIEFYEGGVKLKHPLSVNISATYEYKYETFILPYLQYIGFYGDKITENNLLPPKNYTGVTQNIMKSFLQEDVGETDEYDTNLLMSNEARAIYNVYIEIRDVFPVLFIYEKTSDVCILLRKPLRKNENEDINNFQILSYSFDYDTKNDDKNRLLVSLINRIENVFNVKISNKFYIDTKKMYDQPNFLKFDTMKPLNLYANIPDTYIFDYITRKSKLEPNIKEISESDNKDILEMFNYNNLNVVGLTNVDDVFDVDDIEDDNASIRTGLSKQWGVINGLWSELLKIPTITERLSFIRFDAKNNTTRIGFEGLTGYQIQKLIDSVSAEKDQKLPKDTSPIAFDETIDDHQNVEELATLEQNTE